MRWLSREGEGEGGGGERERERERERHTHTHTHKSRRKDGWTDRKWAGAICLDKQVRYLQTIVYLDGYDGSPRPRINCNRMSQDGCLCRRLDIRPTETLTKHDAGVKCLKGLPEGFKKVTCLFMRPFLFNVAQPVQQTYIFPHILRCSGMPARETGTHTEL